MSLKLSAGGSLVEDAVGSRDGDKLVGKAGAGTFKLDMHVKLEGHLKVDAGTVKYDGDLPGLKDIDIPIAGSAPFDGFLLDGDPAQVSADVPETKLPDIPLGSVPGHLSITVASGTKITSSFHGSCLTVKASQATLAGTTSTGGTILLKPSLVLEVPLFSKTIDLPVVTVNVPSSVKELDSAPAGADGVADATAGACGASPATPAGDAGSPPPSGADGGSDSAQSSGDDACGAKATSGECYLCCDTNHPAGANAYFAFLHGCACGSSGACATQCASDFCSDPNAVFISDACTTCLQAATACIASARSSCEQVGGDCAADLACGDNQGCKAKP
jgi:hypothetical protein